MLTPGNILNETLGQTAEILAEDVAGKVAEDGDHRQDDDRGEDVPRDGELGQRLGSRGWKTGRKLPPTHSNSQLNTIQVTASGASRRSPERNALRTRRSNAIHGKGEASIVQDAAGKARKIPIRLAP